VEVKSEEGKPLFLKVCAPDLITKEVEIGDSIAVNGTCLTVIELAGEGMAAFECMEETVRRTMLADCRIGDIANLELAAEASTRMGGHIVQGHVNEVCKVDDIEEHQDGSWTFHMRLPDQVPDEPRQLVHKGYVALDGMSLTVAGIEENGFRVCIIPHTFKVTNISNWKQSTRVNIEYDRVGEHLVLDDVACMRMAIKEGEKGRETAPSNPWVGCVIERNGSIESTGYHKKSGTPHAELVALNKVSWARGNYWRKSTIYTTLEPCNHYGRTPPCTDAIIKAGFKRVVTACQDPDDRVAGTGIAKLRDAGIEVVSGVLEEEASWSLRSYLHHRRTGYPYVVLKTASSLDSKVACADGSSQWITGVEARKDVHNLRAESQAIICGSGTVLKDNPSLTVRRGRDTDVRPLRVVLDGSGKLGPGGDLDKTKLNLFNTSIAPTLFVTSSRVSSDIQEYWKKQGVEVLIVPEINGRLNLVSVLDNLGKRGILQLMVEGGSKVYSDFISRGLVQEIVMYQGNCLIGSNGLSAFRMPIAEKIENVPRLKLKDVKTFGNDVKMTYVLYK